MKDKTSRLEVIKMIVSHQAIGSQEELLKEMDKAGFPVTQATLSRDLRQLKVSKTSTPSGKYIYVLPTSPHYKRVPEPVLQGVIRSWGVRSIRFSGQMAVLHTLPGHASPIAYEIDNRKPEEIIGTIAGDDTIMMVLAEGVSHEQALQSLQEVVPELSQIINNEEK